MLIPVDSPVACHLGPQTALAILSTLPLYLHDCQIPTPIIDLLTPKTKRLRIVYVCSLTRFEGQCFNNHSMTSFTALRSTQRSFLPTHYRKIYLCTQHRSNDAHSNKRCHISQSVFTPVPYDVDSPFCLLLGSGSLY